MAIPLRPYDLEYNTRLPRSIIIHHSVEIDLKVSSLILDTEGFQTPILQKQYYRKFNETNLPYHFVIEMVKDDFTIVVTRPLLTKVLYGDMDDEFQCGIHIGILGSLDLDSVPDRLYGVLASKLVAPLMRAFRINIDQIYTHSDIAYDPETVVCPGHRFIMSKFKGILRNHIRKVSINRG